MCVAACGSSDAPSSPSRPTTPTPLPPAAAEPGRYSSDLFANVQTTPNLTYGTSVSFGATAGTARQLDLFDPQGDTLRARPAIVLIHGGGFFLGNRNDPSLVDLARRLARRGFVTASISYRLRTEAQVAADPSGTIRDAVDDAKAAVRWFKANATTLRVDSSRVAVIGASAGGFTALGVAYLEGEGGSGSPGPSSDVRAIVSFWGGMLDANELQAGEAPVMLIHGTADAVVPYSASVAVQQRAQQVGVPSDLRTMTGAGHTFWIPMADYVTWTSAFLRTHLALP